MNQNYAKMKLSENSVSKINHLRNIANQNLQSHDEINRSLINNFAEQLIHGEPIDLKGFRNGNLALYSRFSYFVRNVIRIASDTHVEGPVFSETSEWVQLLIKNEPVDINDSHYNSSIHRYIRSRLKVINRKEAERFLDFLKTAGYSFDQILLLIMYEAFPFTRIWQEEISESNLNSMGLIIRDRIIASRSKSFLKSVFGSKDAIVADLLNCNLSRSGLALAKLFYFIDPPLIDEHLNELLVRNPNNGTEKRFSIHVAKYLLDINYKKYANQLIQKTDKIPFAADTHFELTLTLAEGDSSTYHVHAMKMGDSIFDHMIQTLKNRDSVYIPRVRKKPATITHLEYLFNYDPELCYTKLLEYIDALDKVPSKIISFIGDNFGEDTTVTKATGGSILIKCMDKAPKEYSSSFYYSLFQNFTKVDFNDEKEEVVAFLIATKNKNARYEGAKAISKYANDIKGRAIELLHGKVIGQRLIGALILASMEDPGVKDVLNEAVDIERNDETRNIMLESVYDQRFEKPAAMQAVLEMIEFANKRKKLSKWSEKWIEEDKLPKIYWQNGELLDQNAIRFLFYRMKQVKGINSDVEARFMLQLIDKKRSEQFALFLLQSFVDSNADTKFKYYLTLCGLLGSDNVLNKLHSLFRKSITDKRVKMAEYVLGAIAMIGNDKALRILEVLSRKYANKKPKLSQAAIASLDAAAQELGITKDQLADRIIPNFDFDGIFKEFDVEGDTYRAFIGQEFKLVYYNEDNKMRKSIPKGADASIKKQFAAIGKEVRDVVKSQGDRLERYMVNGRKWEADNWRTFFFENPIMFVYALKLLWYVEDAEGNFKTIFYCDEDAEMYDVEDEEVEIDATDLIRIVHPLMIDSELLSHWKQKAAEDELETIFPILDRPIFYKEESEMESHYTSVYNELKIPKGADFVAPQLVKRGWYKSPADGGSLEFIKKSGTGITAYPYIEGPAAYYQGGNVEAKIYTVSFIGKSWKEKVLIKDVPPVFYSEVMADLDYLIKAT